MDNNALCIMVMFCLLGFVRVARNWLPNLCLTGKPFHRIPDFVQYGHFLREQQFVLEKYFSLTLLAIKAGPFRPHHLGLSKGWNSKKSPAYFFFS